MDIALFHSIWTVVVLVVFVGITLWAYSSRRQSDFDEAANLPLDDDTPINDSRSNMETPHV
jgi:cytochrome c oxidase cbb3-type subunit IV